MATERELLLKKIIDTKNMFGEADKEIPLGHEYWTWIEEYKKLPLPEEVKNGNTP